MCLSTDDSSKDSSPLFLSQITQVTMHNNRHKQNLNDLDADTNTDRRQYDRDTAFCGCFCSGNKRTCLAFTNLTRKLAYGKYSMVCERTTFTKWIYSTGRHCGNSGKIHKNPSLTARKFCKEIHPPLTNMKATLNLSKVSNRSTVQGDYAGLEEGDASASTLKNKHIISQ